MEGEDSELTEQDKRTLKALARTIRESEVDRRDLLKMGLGGAIGVGASQLVTGGAMASASTTDSDGDIGTPSNRVDVFSDGVDANSVTTDVLNTADATAAAQGEVLQKAASGSDLEFAPGSGGATAENTEYISDHANGGSGTTADPYTSSSGTGGFEEAMAALSDEGGVIVWDGFSQFSSTITIPESQYNLRIFGSHLGGGALAASFSDSELFDIQIDGADGSSPDGGGGMRHVFDGLSFFGNKDNVTADVDFLVDTQSQDRILISYFNDLMIADFTGNGFVLEGNVGRINSCDILYCENAGIRFRSGDIRALDTTVNSCGQTDAVPGVVFENVASACKFINGEITLCDEDTASGVQVSFSANTDGNRVFQSKLQARASQDADQPYSVAGDNNEIIHCFGQNEQTVQNTIPQYPEQTRTTGVTSGDTSIWTLPTNRTGALVIVTGQDADSTPTMFTDAVLFVRGGGATNVIGSVEESSPVSRTYHRFNNDLEIDIASDTYDIAARGVPAEHPGV